MRMKVACEDAPEQECLDRASNASMSLRWVDTDKGAKGCPSPHCPLSIGRENLLELQGRRCVLCIHAALGRESYDHCHKRFGVWKRGDMDNFWKLIHKDVKEAHIAACDRDDVYVALADEDAKVGQGAMLRKWACRLRGRAGLRGRVHLEDENGGGRTGRTGDVRSHDARFLHPAIAVCRPRRRLHTRRRRGGLSVASGEDEGVL